MEGSCAPNVPHFSQGHFLSVCSGSKQNPSAKSLTIFFINFLLRLRRRRGRVFAARRAQSVPFLHFKRRSYHKTAFLQGIILLRLINGKQIATLFFGNFSVFSRFAPCSKRENARTFFTKIMPAFTQSSLTTFIKRVSLPFSLRRDTEMPPALFF